MYTGREYNCTTNDLGMDCHDFPYTSPIVIPEITAGDLLVAFFLMIIFLTISLKMLISSVPKMIKLSQRYTRSGKIYEADL